MGMRAVTKRDAHGTLPSRVYYNMTVDVVDEFGDRDKTIEFYNSMWIDGKPKTKKHEIRKGNIQYFEMKLQICTYCKETKPFTDCKNFVKRMVDMCKGSTSEMMLDVDKIMRQGVPNE